MPIPASLLFLIIKEFAGSGTGAAELTEPPNKSADSPTPSASAKDHKLIPKALVPSPIKSKVNVAKVKLSAWNVYRSKAVSKDSSNRFTKSAPTVVYVILPTPPSQARKYPIDRLKLDHHKLRS